VSPSIFTTAWHDEPEPVAESTFTVGAGPAWSAWNAWSPEVEICRFLAELVTVLRPRHIVETGTGQGFVTRRVAARLRDGQRLTCYESGADWRAALRSLDFFDGERRVLASGATPDEEVLSSAEVCLFDSDFSYRLPELQRWSACARPGAVVFVHDAGNVHVDEPEFALTRAVVEELAIPGVFLDNPRGGFVGHKPTGPGARQDPAGSIANRLVRVEAELHALRSTKTFRYTARARDLYGRLVRSRRRG